MPDTPELIKRLLACQGNVYVCSINKEDPSQREVRLTSKDERELQDFARVKDVPGRATFFCISTMKRNRRNKDNALESPFLFADVDFKAVNGTKDEILSALQASLGLPPSLIVFTGNGFHVYWYLKKPSLPENQAAFENTLRRLAWVVSGDPMVCHVAAVLRYPGTHNSKRGQWTEVEVVGGSGNEYTFAAVNQWLAEVSEPVITRRPTERDSNPFLAAANDMGFRPPMDPEEELEAMTLGSGDNGVHSTQLRVAASFMSAGLSVDDAVAKIMEATERCAEPGWNMVAERRAVRKMCTDWLRKHPRASGEASMEDHGDDEYSDHSHRDHGDDDDDDDEEEEQPKVRKKPSGKKRAGVRGFGEDDGPENVVSLSQAREHRHDPDDEPDSAVAPAKKKKLKKGNEHCVLAPGILAAMADRDEHMLYTEGRLHLYRSGLWRIQTSDEEKAFIEYQVEVGCRALNIPATIKIANETRAALRREPTIHKHLVDWDAHGKIPVKNGLVNPDTLDIEPYKPEHYATSAMDVLHDREATAPRWIRMIEELLPDRETRDFLQECVGMAMVKTKARSLTRALILLGPSFSGKSNVLNIVSSLIAKEVNSTALEMLENSHGLVKFLQPHPWVLHEAFEQSRWEMSANVKALISGDPVTVNVKNGPLVTHRYRGAVLWATNVPPQFKEASRAIETRIAVVKFKKVFDPAVVTGLAREAQDEGYSSIAEMILDTERSGLLNWALEGMRRAQDRGHFVFTRDMNTELEQIRNTSNPAVGFFANCVEFDKDSMVHWPDIYASFVAWWEENQGGPPPTTNKLSKFVASMADARLLSPIRFNQANVTLGIKLSGEGLDFWNASANVANMERSTLRISGRMEEVNQDIPDRLREREDVRAWTQQMWGEATPERRSRPRRTD